jgi:BNR/Asp-box repeat.
MDTRVYAGYDDGLRIVDPETGSVSVRLADRAVECLSVVSGGEGHASEDLDDARVLAGTFDAGLFRSTDDGESFERVAAESLGPGGSGPDAVTAVATSPHDPAVVWIGTEPSRVYRSTDGGETVQRIGGLTEVPSASAWSFPPRPDTHHVRWIEPCPADPERWFVGIEAGALVVTPDGGETWVDRPEGSRRDTHALATHPDAPDRVYAAAGDGFAESHDRGDSWRVVDRGLDHGYVWGARGRPRRPGDGARERGLGSEGGAQPRRGVPLPAGIGGRWSGRRR